MEYYSPFWGPKAISMIVEPQVVLICWSSRLAVWADSGPFLGLLLRGHKVIYTIDEPQGTFTCRSSELTILAYSGPFHALLLRVLGSQSDLHD